jgi:DNA-binding response OmpR family regulator
MNKQRVFLVEDEPNFGTVLKSYLEINDLSVQWVSDGKDAIEAFNDGTYDICILDVMLPNVDGFTIGESIRTINPDIPIIFLTAKSLKEDMIKGYKIGADDYITKPFDSELLLFKIKAILKRNVVQKKEDNQEEFVIGKLNFSYPKRSIVCDGNTIKLSPKESELLKLLCQNQGRVLSREEALLKIWGEEGYFTTRSMDVYITKLRGYLKCEESLSIENVHGSGFILRQS